MCERCEFEKTYENTLNDINNIFKMLVKTLIKEYYSEKELIKRYDDDNEEIYDEFINYCANGCSPIELYSFHRIIRNTFEYKKSYEFIKNNTCIILDIIIQNLENYSSCECFINSVIKKCLKDEAELFNVYFYHYLHLAEETRNTIDKEINNIKTKLNK